MSLGFDLLAGDHAAGYQHANEGDPADDPDPSPHGGTPVEIVIDGKHTQATGQALGSMTVAFSRETTILPAMICGDRCQRLDGMSGRAHAGRVIQKAPAPLQRPEAWTDAGESGDRRG